MHRSIVRTPLMAALALALVAGSGCGWIKSKIKTDVPYQDSQMARPLEMPPGLDKPGSTGGMAIPDAAGVSGGSVQTLPPGMDASAGVAGVSELRLAGSLESAYPRLGQALEGLDGVEVLSRAQLLNSYEVRFEGQTMLLRAEQSGDAVRVTALSGSGQVLAGGAGARLLGLLQPRLQ
ncbi:MAG TPA: hypothetical protein VFY12_11385 [Arenimonas sp.]|nr:hypothetical protein [Arenimonas sp.]